MPCPVHELQPLCWLWLGNGYVFHSCKGLIVQWYCTTGVYLTLLRVFGKSHTSHDLRGVLWVFFPLRNASGSKTGMWKLSVVNNVFLKNVSFFPSRKLNLLQTASGRSHTYRTYSANSVLLSFSCSVPCLCPWQDLKTRWASAGNETDSNKLRSCP